MDTQDFIEVVNHLRNFFAANSWVNRVNENATSVRANTKEGSILDTHKLKENIIEPALSQPPKAWSAGRLAAFDSLNASRFIGVGLLAEFEAIMAEPSHGQRNTRMEHFIRELKEFHGHINKLVAGFEAFNPPVRHLPSSYALYHYSGEASAETLLTLTRQLERTHKQLKMIGRIAGEVPEDPGVIEVGKGSIDIAIDISVNLTWPLMIVTAYALDWLRDKRKSRAAVESMSVIGIDDNPELKKMIDQHAEEEGRKQLDIIVDEVTEQVRQYRGLEDSANDEINEVRNAVRSSLEDIASFVEQGGQITAQLPGGKEPPKLSQEEDITPSLLRQKYQELNDDFTEPSALLSSDNEDEEPLE